MLKMGKYRERGEVVGLSLPEIFKSKFQNSQNAMVLNTLRICLVWERDNTITAELCNL